MHVRKKLFYFITVCSASAVAVIVLCFIVLNPCPSYACLGFPGDESWRVQKTYEQTNVSWKGLLKAPNYLVRLERVAGVTRKQADDFTTIRTMQMEGLFDRARSPYPGAVSDEIVCESKYRPTLNSFVSKTGIPVTYFSGYLNDRYQYGSCVDSQIFYKAHSGMFYCQNTRQWYQVELIIPIDKALSDEQYLSLFKNVKCFDAQFFTKMHHLFNSF